MARAPSDTQGPALRGRTIVRLEIERRGGVVRDASGDHVPYLEIHFPNRSRRLRVRVKTRTKGTWQSRATDGSPSPPPQTIPTFWVFVDLTQQPVAFFVVPDDVVRRDIHADHQAYLKRHGGRRAVNQESDHHAIQLDHVVAWKDRWDLILADSE